MAKPIIALLTDFGTRDHYAAVMKGVVLCINPEAQLVDLSHDLPPHNITLAALELEAGEFQHPDIGQHGEHRLGWRGWRQGHGRGILIVRERFLGRLIERLINSGLFAG